MYAMTHYFSSTNHKYTYVLGTIINYIQTWEINIFSFYSPVGISLKQNKFTSKPVKLSRQSLNDQFLLANRTGSVVSINKQVDT